MPKEMLVDMKLTKSAKKEMKADMMPEMPEYPYGLTITLEADQLNKLPSTKNLKVGDMVDINALGNVKMIKIIEKENNNSRMMEFQLQKIWVGNDTQLQKDFDEE